MLGIFGVIIYSIAATIGWAQDENQEQHARKDSANKGLSYYVDKRGRQRWTSNGRKRSAQEIRQEYKDREKRHREESGRVCLERWREHYKHYPWNEYVTFEEYIRMEVLPGHKEYLEYRQFREIKETIPKERLYELQRKYGNRYRDRLVYEED